MVGDPANPGGYRPDDPRYGLSGQALQDYYLAQPPQWLIRSMYAPGAAEKREAAMEAHLSHQAGYRDHVHFAGPILSDDGSTPLGTMCIIELPDRAAAEDYVSGDGFAKAGMLEPPTITRFVSSKRLKYFDRDPDPNLQLFVCECLDGPDAATLRPKTAADHHDYQGSLIDNYFAHGPLRSNDGTSLLGSLFLIEVADRNTAELLVANEPMTVGGVFSEINIHRWRFGKTLA
ncbi:MAG: YciI family protein [Alphaproteobacteria bacterium]